MSINIVGSGTWGAFAVALHGVAIEGMESPGGMPAVCWLGGAADREGYVCHQHYCHAIDKGSRTLRIAISVTVGDPALACPGAAVGEGLSTRAAGDRLGITEATASVLTIVYDKPNIGRQSDLARIVARPELA